MMFKYVVSYSSARANRVRPAKRTQYTSLPNFRQTRPHVRTRACQRTRTHTHERTHARTPARIHTISVITFRPGLCAACAGMQSAMHEHAFVGRVWKCSCRDSYCANPHRTDNRRLCALRCAMSIYYLLVVDLSSRDRPFQPNVYLIICIHYAERAAACVHAPVPTVSVRPRLPPRDCVRVMHPLSEEWSERVWVNAIRRGPGASVPSHWCTEAAPELACRQTARCRLRCHRLCTRHV